jgi:hypothetical protein
VLTVNVTGTLVVKLDPLYTSRFVDWVKPAGRPAGSAVTVMLAGAVPPETGSRSHDTEGLITIRKPAFCDSADTFSVWETAGPPTCPLIESDVGLTETCAKAVSAVDNNSKQRNS